MSISAIGSGLSGLQAFQRGLDTSANNVANVATNGYQPQQISFKDSANGSGVTTIVTGNGSNGTYATATTPSETDLTKETVQSMIYQANFDASAKVIKTADQMLGTLVNTTA